MVCTTWQFVLEASGVGVKEGSGNPFWNEMEQRL